MNGVEDPGILEGFRLAGVDLRSLRQSLQHHLARLVAIVDDHHLDIALPHPLGDSLDGLFGRGSREVFLCLGHIWIFSFYINYIIAPPLASIRLSPRRPEDW